MNTETVSGRVSNLRTYISQNGFKPLFWRMVNALYFYWNSLLETLHYYVLMRHRQTIKIQTLNHDYMMALNPHDKGLSKELRLYGFREPYATRLISTVVKDGDVIIDVGANVGYFALFESKLAPNGIVHAIEPVPENFDYLKTNVDLNGCTNTRLYNYALGNKNGTGVIFISEARNLSSLSAGSNKGVIQEENVLVTTLDSFVDDHVKRCPTLVRMDVEGYEYQILKGALNVLKDCRALKLVIELHPSKMAENVYDDMLNTLEAQGFKASAFNDPDLYNIKHEQLSNKLRKRAHLKLYGFLGEGYDVLHELKKENIKIEALFTREEP